MFEYREIGDIENPEVGDINQDDQFPYHKISRTSTRKVSRLLTYLWVAVILTLECILYEFNAIRCRNHTSGHAGKAFLILADPQLTDQYSYRQKDGFVMEMTKFISDLFMKRNLNSIKRWSTFSEVYILGDLFDGGREWEDDRWQGELIRFKRLFNKSLDPIPIHYVAGNHDIGVGTSVIPHALERYEKEFDVNYVKKVGDYAIVVIDAPSLAGDSIKAKEFITEAGEMPGKKIVLSHIPLYRRSNTGCKHIKGSKLRPEGIKDGWGYQYQNLLSINSTNFILATLKPALILSGDDHTTCWIEHDLPDTKLKVSEFSIPSFSWLQGTDEPGYAFMNLLPQDDSPDIKLCIFHKQLNIYLFYGLLGVTSLATLLYYSILNRDFISGLPLLFLKVITPGAILFLALAFVSFI